VFIQRFFGMSQFKRSCVPNAPKVGSGGSLSPRGDWRAPSDGEAAVWLAELEKNVPDEEE
jgi:NAD+ synthase (glutamine-hydrolysing)